MPSDKHQQLVDRLIAKTESGQLEWRETAEPNTAQVSFPNYSITLTERKLEVGYCAYLVGIWNSEGRRVDLFTSDALDPRYKEKVARLYQTARHQELGADKALDEILSQLRDDD